MEVIKSLHFGSLLARKSRVCEFILKNPARQKLNWKIFVGKELNDIFTVVDENQVYEKD